MSNLSVVDLDFDRIRENLKESLRNQNYFTDYDFEGSGLSILLNVLAHDTTYKAWLANMVINERFLDTAVKRASVVSHTKPLGYLPRSTRAAMANVTVTVYGTSTNYNMLMDKFTTFKTDVNGTAYTFVTTKAYTAIPSGEFNAYIFDDVQIFEGTPLEYSYVVGNPTATFKVPSNTADISTLSIVVQDSATNTTKTIYEYADSVALIDGNSKVFFLQESTDGYYHVYFGDGILGKKLSVGNIITMTFISTSGAAANTSALYSQSFTLTGTISGYGDTNVIVTTNSPSSGGGDKESTDSIRFLAPRNFSAQGRTVTVDDYKTMILKDFPEIESAIVWGGEDNVPPIHGKVFIALKPAIGYIASTGLKDKISKYLKKKSIVSIQFDFADADFTFISVTADVKYDSMLTNYDSPTIAALTSTAITNYFNANLQKFDSRLYVSRLQTLIDGLDPSIKGNTVTLRLQKRIEPIISLTSTHTLYFNNRLTPFTLYTSAFNTVIADQVETVYLKDTANTTPPDLNGSGTLSMYRLSDNSLVAKNVGTINYADGKVILSNIMITGFPSAYMYDVRVSVQPQSQIDEISSRIISESSTSAYIPVPMQNQILMLDDSIEMPSYNIRNGLAVTATPV